MITSCNYLQEKSLPTITHLEAPKTHKAETVAVLPFNNLTEIEDAAHILRLAFSSNLSTKGYDIIRPEKIDFLLEMAEINSSNLELIGSYQLGKILKADALIYGTITRCSKLFAGIYSNVAIGAEMRMIDAATSKTIWEAQHVEMTHGGSPLVSPITFPVEVAASILNLRDKVLQDTADRLAKKFIAGIPENAFEAAPETMVIFINGSGDNRTVNYTVQSGDTLYAIAEKFYGDGSRWIEIREANNNLHESFLKTGQKLLIPNIPIIDNLNDIYLLQPGRSKNIVYKVKWEDSLYGIATALYNDGEKWREIYEINKEAIISVTDLPVGQILILPLKSR